MRTKAVAGTTRVFWPVQKRRVYSIVRKKGGERYVYPRISLEGGALSALGLKAGQSVIVEHRRGEIRIRPLRKRTIIG